MRIDMLRLPLGVLLCLATVSCSINAIALGKHRTDKPPVISIICILDGFGGGDCTLPDGSKKYMAPSEMVNMWATTQTDEANFASWCYKTNPQNVQTEMKKIENIAHE